MTKPKIGFIGLGLMGSAMVERLQARGYEVAVLGHRSRAGVEAALARGATEAASAAEVAAKSDVTMFCMGTSAQVESRVYGPGGVLEGVAPGAVVIDFGTSLPASTSKIGAALAERGAAYLDAPLGRTPAHAVEGRLNIMCAGDAAAFERVRPVLDDLGENVFHLGALGAGHTVKLINNFFGMTVAGAMAEAFATADAAGIDREVLYGVMAAGPLHSGMMDFIHAYATEGRIDLAFSVENAAKDVGYYHEMVRALGSTTRMSAGTNDLFAAAAAAGWSTRMVPELVDFMTQGRSEA